MSDVTFHLVDQLVRRLKPHLAAEPRDEAHTDGFAVEIAREVRKVRFEQGKWLLVVERRTSTQRDGGWMLISVISDEPAGIDAVRRKLDRGRHGHIGRRETQLAAAPVAFLNDPSHLVG